MGARAALAAALLSPHSLAPEACFEPNRGQADRSAAFVARASGYAVLLRRDGGAVYHFPGAADDTEPLIIDFPGGHARPGIGGEHSLVGVTNYYGGLGKNWLPAVPHYERVRFRGVYPGIDLVWRARGADLEYEFLAAAGSDPGRIRMRFTGASRVSLDADGNLLLETPSGTVRHRRPMAWQETAGGRREIRVALRLEGKTAAFQVGTYDRRRPLVIDPVVAYATYVGGAGYDAGYAIAVDGSGGIYMAGATSSIGFPAQGSGVNANTDAFVMKFDETGALLYTTILASNGTTSGQAIAVDLSGNVYVAGTTQASNFPVTPGAWQTVFGGVADAFAVKLNAAGNLVYASYIGGPGQETGTGIALDPSGNVYISGYTTSNFPATKGAPQTIYGGGFSDAFLVKLNAQGSAAVYATLLGGTGTDLANAVTVDGAGHACIAGYTDSANLPVYGALQPSPGGEGDALVACLSADGTAWTMVSYLGGSNLDQAFALGIDPGGNLYVAGATYSPDFPVTAGVFQTVNAGGYDAFIAKLSPGGFSLAYSTYLGGNSSDAALALAVGSAGDVWVGGYTESTNFPLSGAWQSAAAGSFDGFVSHLSSDAGLLLTSSYLGGAGDDRVLGIASDSAGLVFAAGSTLSVNFPVTPGALQTVAPAGMNAFLAAIAPTAYAISGQVTTPAGAPLSGITVTLSGAAAASTSTDSNGHFLFNNVPGGGSYTITPSSAAFAFTPPSQAFPDLTASQNAVFTGAAAYSITGQISVSGAGPLSGAAVTLSGTTSGAATTSATGYYSFTGLPMGGTYTVAPSPAGLTFNPASATFTNLTSSQAANFTGQCGYSVSPTAVYLDATSQTGPALTVTTAPACTWTASASAFAAITSGAAGAGNGAVIFNLTANTSGAVRSGSITVAGQTVTVTQRATTAIFADVTAPDYFFDFAGLMYQSAITSGCSSQPLDYCPNSTTTRAQMAVFLITAIERGNSFSYSTTPYFTDVPPSSAYFKFIQKLRDLGITNGCSPTTYCPNDSVTRAQMAVFIIASRYGATPFTFPSTPYFTDVAPASPFFPFVQKMAQSGITSGCAPGTYCPDQVLTRGQMGVFVVTGLLNALLVPGTPMIASVLPNSAAPGQAVTVTLTGANTHFAQGVTQVVAPAGITPSNISVLSGTSLTVTLAVGASAAPNPTSIVVTTGPEEAVLPNGFLVQ